MNLYRFSHCPCCGSGDILSVGCLNYGPDIQFSSTIIHLNCVPELWKCGACSSRFSQYILSEADANHLYANTDASTRWRPSPFCDSKSSDLVEAMAALLKGRRRILDVGCNTGELLDFARAQGCETAGVELSAKSLDVLVSKGHAAYADIEQAGEDYDVVTAFDIIEHLHDPRRFIERCTDRLVPGGLLVIMTGDISSPSARIASNNWWYMQYPEHIVFPSRKFFMSLPGFCDIKSQSTWANTYHRTTGIWQILSNLRVSLRTGRPALGPDHSLWVMRRV